jgi:hypothetical protein
VCLNLRRLPEHKLRCHRKSCANFESEHEIVSFHVYAVELDPTSIKRGSCEALVDSNTSKDSLLIDASGARCLRQRSPSGVR